MQKELLSAYMDGEEVSAELTEQLCQDKRFTRVLGGVSHSKSRLMRKRVTSIIRC